MYTLKSSAYTSICSVGLRKVQKNPSTEPR